MIARVMWNYPWAALAVALLPLPVGYVRGRRLLRRVDEPTFAEEWWGHRIETYRFAIAALAGASALAVRRIAACGWWSRRWPVGSATFRRADSGPRTATSSGAVSTRSQRPSAPREVRVRQKEERAERPRLIVQPLVLPLLVVLLAWQIAYPHLVLRAFDAQPITDEVLTSRFAPMIAKAKCPEPRVASIGPRRGFFVNAFAFPGSPHGSVLLSDTLLRRLEPDETVGIFAHELAHLEEHTPRKASQRQGWTMAWSVVSIGVAWAAARDSDGLALIVGVAWLLVALLAMVARRRRARHHEGESDLRAVELCGDVDFVIRGLTKVHVLNRAPRRWDSANEARLTHPSLARRIQALRQKYGSGSSSAGEAAPPPAPLTVESRKRSGETLTLDAFGVRPPGGDAIPYGELTAIHVRPTLAGPVLVYRRGVEPVSTFPFHRHDAAAVQALLDQVDLHLAPAPAGRTTREKTRPRTLAAGLFLMGVTPGFSVVTMIAALVAFFLPSSAPLAAAGVTAVAAAIAGVQHPPESVPRNVFYFIALVMSAGGMALFTLALGGRDERRRGTWVILVALLVCLTVSALPLFLSPGVAMLIAVARDRPGVVISLLGIAAAPAFLPRRAWRFASLLPLLFAAGLTYTAASSRMNLSADDSLRSAQPARTVPAPRLLASMDLDRPVDQIQLSPDGERFVARRRSENDEDEDLQTATFVLGALHQAPQPIADALTISFAGNDRLKIHELHDGKVRVRVTTFDGHDVSIAPEVEATPPAGAFSFVNTETHVAWVRAHRDPAAFALTTVHRQDIFIDRVQVLQTYFNLRLREIPGDDAHILYFATDRATTNAGMVDLATRRFRPILSLPEVILQAEATSDGRLIARTTHGAVLLVDLHNHTVARLAETDVTDPVDLAINGHTAAVVQWTEKGSKLFFYAVP